MSATRFLAAVFVQLVLSRVVFSLVRRDYERRGRLGLWAATLQFLVFAMYAVLMYLALLQTSWPKLPPGVVQQVVAVVSAGLGLGVLLAAFGVFKSVGRVFGRRSDELRRSGVYRWSRNPQLVGYGMILLAFAVLWPQWQVAVAMLVYAAIAYWMVRVEEEHLLRHYARDYAEYCERTPRWVRFPWVGQDR